MKNGKGTSESGGAPVAGGVINRLGDELSTASSASKKKSPFKNTLKKKNGIYKGISRLISRGRARARAYAEACGCPVAEAVAAREAAEAFGGTDADRHLWEGAAFALGLDAFLEVFFRQRSENAADGAPRDVRRAFQAKLNRELAATCGADGARSTPGNDMHGVPALPSSKGGAR